MLAVAAETVTTAMAEMPAGMASTGAAIGREPERVGVVRSVWPGPPSEAAMMVAVAAVAMAPARFGAALGVVGKSH